MPPKLFWGRNGGKFVLQKDGKKVYIPSNFLKWTKERERWRLWLTDGTKMLLKPLEET